MVAPIQRGAHSHTLQDPARQSTQRQAQDSHCIVASDVGAGKVAEVEMNKENIPPVVRYVFCGMCQSCFLNGGIGDMSSLRAMSC